MQSSAQEVPDANYVLTHSDETETEANNRNSPRRIIPDSYQSIAKMILVNSLPVMIGMFALFSDRFYSLYLLRKTTDNSLTVAASGIGGTWLMLISTSLFMSLNIGLTTRTSHAFGSKDYRLVGLTMHRAFIINFLVLIPCLLLLLFSKQAFSLFGFDPSLSDLVNSYLIWCVPGVIVLVIYTTLACVLNGCGLFKIPAAIQTVAAIIYWIWAYIFIDVFQLGLIGMAISFNITWFLATGALLYFLKYRNPINQVFFMPEEESYKEVWEQFKYEVVVGAMSWADFIAIEVLSIFTGRLSTDEIAGFTSASTVYRMPAPFIIGMIITSITFIGQAMGNGDTEKAKKVIKVVAAISEGFGLLMLIIAIFWRDTILQKFATDSSFAVASAVLTVHLFGCPVDSVQGVLSATLRGIKKERIGAIMIIICDYGVAIPCAFIACFVIGMGAPGITLGSVISHYCKLFLFGREIIFRTNWEKQIEIVKSQLKKKESGDIEFKTFKDERAGDMIQLDTN